MYKNVRNPSCAIPFFLDAAPLLEVDGKRFVCSRYLYDTPNENGLLLWQF